MKKLLCISILFFFGFCHGVFCQYLPIGILPMEYNPSFAGSVGNTRTVADIKYTDYNKSITGDGMGLSFSVDKYIQKIRSGIGIVANGYKEMPLSKDEDNYRYWKVSLIVAPKISIKGKYTLSPSFDLQYSNIDFGADFPYNDDSKFNGVIGNFGILFNAHNYYIGYALRIFKSEGLKYINGEGLYSVIQAGYSYQKENSKFSFTPQIALPIIDNQNINIAWPSYNLGFRYDRLLIAAMSQFDYIYPTGFQLGWQNNGCRILLSNDFADGYAANLTFRYIFNLEKDSMNILKNMY